MVCLAFPDGIPLQLTKRGVIHDTPYPGDHGIQYEKYLGEDLEGEARHGKE